MSATRKANARKRLKAVDQVIEALSSSTVTCGSLERVKLLPKETEMSPREKYSVFAKNDPKGGRFRKSLHKVPHYTKIPLSRTTPEGF